MSDEIKIGTIVEIIKNEGPSQYDYQIGSFATVKEIAVQKDGRVAYCLDKFSKVVVGDKTQEMVHFITEIRKVDFSKFFDARRQEILMLQEIEKASKTEDK